VNKPATLPGITNRPSTLPGVINKPSTLPGDINKPSTLPGVGNRPTTLPGNITRPGVGGDRPTTLPGTVKPPTIGGGNRPGIGGDRPNFGGDNRPGNRPGNRPNDRPVIGGNKPGWNVDRPNIGNGNNNNIVNRPINRPNIGNGSGNNINIGNTVNVGNRYPNRPNWDLDPGYSRPSWGLNGNDRHNNSNHNCINNHHNWYNGCWHGYWGSSWYAPVAWGAVGWGLNSFTTGWGYNTAYYNPYYATPAVAQSVPYDYSQPVVVNNYVSSDSTSQGGDSQATQVNNDQDVALAAFDKGLDQFKSGAYANALAEFNAALKKLPGDPVVHETRCLALFATADYSAAAAGLNSLLSAAPGMDWTTMSGLYGDANDYTKQFRALESYCVSNPTDAPSHFVLAYHYLVTGAKDAAVDALKVVVKAQPKDVTAKRMLTALAPETVPAPATPAAPTPTTTAGNTADASPAETDLVGVWTAKANDSMITLSITEDSKFTWTASEKGQTAIELKGDLSSAADGISLQTPDQGTVAGAVKSNGPDSWNFLISGSPANDPGLKFDRKK
jgi:tetratricopeptide (TPR) repeat protein